MTTNVISFNLTDKKKAFEGAIKTIIMSARVFRSLHVIGVNNHTPETETVNGLNDLYRYANLAMLEIDEMIQGAPHYMYVDESTWTTHKATMYPLGERLSSPDSTFSSNVISRRYNDVMNYLFSIPLDKQLRDLADIVDELSVATEVVNFFELNPQQLIRVKRLYSRDSKFMSYMRAVSDLQGVFNNRIGIFNSSVVTQSMNVDYIKMISNLVGKEKLDMISSDDFLSTLQPMIKMVENIYSTMNGMKVLRVLAHKDTDKSRRYKRYLSSVSALLNKSDVLLTEYNYIESVFQPEKVKTKDINMVEYIDNLLNLAYDIRVNYENTIKFLCSISLFSKSEMESKVESILPVGKIMTEMDKLSVPLSLELSKALKAERERTEGLQDMMRGMQHSINSYLDACTKY